MLEVVVVVVTIIAILTTAATLVDRAKAIFSLVSRHITIASMSKDMEFFIGISI
jgi:hypothetical protein